MTRKPHTDPEDSLYLEEDPSPSETPAILEKANIQISLPDALNESSTLKQAQRADVQVTNDMLTTCYHAIGQAKSLSSLFRGVDTALKVIEVRRKVLNLEYGASDKGSGRIYTEPLED